MTGDANVPQGQALFVVFQLISAPPPAGSGTTTGIYCVPAQRVGFFSSTADILLFCQSMRVHADPGTQVSISVRRLNLTSPTGIVGGNFTMTGEIFDAGTLGTSVNF